MDHGRICNKWKIYECDLLCTAFFFVCTSVSTNLHCRVTLLLMMFDYMKNMFDMCALTNYFSPMVLWTAFGGCWSCYKLKSVWRMTLRIINHWRWVCDRVKRPESPDTVILNKAREKKIHCKISLDWRNVSPAKASLDGGSN